MIQQQDTIPHLSNTHLKDRILYYDGDSVVSPDRIIELIDKGLSSIYVEEETDAIRQFNRLAPSTKKIQIKTENRPLTFDWNLPKKYKNLNVIEYVIDKWAVVCVNEEITSEAADIRSKRVSDEIQLYKQLNLLPVLRAIIYVINTLHENNIVWGVGRGSSVSSYVLYLIGVHDVDSVKYDLDFTDFLRRPE